MEKPQIGPAFRRPLGIDRPTSRPRRRAPPRLRARRHPPDDCARASRSRCAARSSAPSSWHHRRDSCEIAKHPQKRFLHAIGGVGIVARQPSRERIGRIEMGQRYRLELSLTMPIGVRDTCRCAAIRRFPDKVDRGHSHVETTAPKKPLNRSFGPPRPSAPRAFFNIEIPIAFQVGAVK